MAAIGRHIVTLAIRSRSAPQRHVARPNRLLSLLLAQDGNVHKQQRAFFSSDTAQDEDHAADVFTLQRRKDVRNISVIAHIDHGKTTLVSQLLEAAGSGSTDDRLLDSGDLEKERGITITGKVTRILHNNIIVNCADTPGHSDFSM